MSKITVGDKTYRCLDGWYQECGDQLVKVTSVGPEVLDEIERLRAMFPKTADGVPVVPGQLVWHRDWRGNVSKAYGEWQSPFPNLLRCCYSTREAAEAARTEVVE